MSIRAGCKRGHGIFAVFAIGLFVGSAVAAVSAANKAAERSSAGGGYDFAPDASTGIAVNDFAFAARSVAVTARTMTEIVVDNEDSALHTFTYEKDGTTDNHEVLPGASAKFLVLFDAPGTYPVWCRPHASKASDGTYEGMVTSIVVSEPSA